MYKVVWNKNGQSSFTAIGFTGRRPAAAFEGRPAVSNVGGGVLCWRRRPSGGRVDVRAPRSIWPRSRGTNYGGPPILPRRDRPRVNIPLRPPARSSPEAPPRSPTPAHGAADGSRHSVPRSRTARVRPPKSSDGLLIFYNIFTFLIHAFNNDITPTPPRGRSNV